MAIYKNREVTIVGPNPQLNNPDSITVAYPDGTHENVSLAGVSFTKDEKNLLVKTYPSRYDTVSTVSDEDIEAVRVGVAPPSDPEVKAQAEMEAKKKMQTELHQKHMDEARKTAESDMKKEVNKPAPKPMATAPAQVK